MKSVKFVSILWLMILSFSGSTNAYWPVVDLGELSKDNYTHLSINNNGIIAGDFYYGGMYNYHAGTYDPMSGDPILDLGTLPGGYSSHANSINDLGQIVGMSIGNDNQWHGTIFDPTGNGANIDLGLGSAEDINNLGQIIYGSYGAYLFDISGNGSPVYLGNVGANSINDVGQIVGSMSSSGGGVYEGPHACLIDASGGGANIDLGTLGGDMSYAKYINDAGLIIGDARVPSGFMRACLFDPSGGCENIDLGTLGGSTSWARSINNRNQVIGSATLSTPGKFHATLFDVSGNGENIDLNDMIDPLSGWELIYGHDINDNGWIVGWGHNPENEIHAFLIIPEATTIYLLVLGGFGLLKRRRKA